MEVISFGISFIICVVLSCFAQSFSQNIKPVNTLTEQSKRTILTCCSERGSIAWKHQKLNNAGVPDQICLDQSCYRTGYSVDDSIPGCFHLIIDSTANDAAGLFQCNEVETGNVRGAYLVVYNFSCSADFVNSDDLVEGDVVTFHCSVSWKGKWPFKIRLLNAHGKQILQKDVINDVNPYYISSFEVKVSKPNFPAYTIQFAFLNNEITDPNVDKSCPAVNWTSSPARNVKYGPSIIKLSCPTEKCEREFGDTINCSADGYPDPELHWLNWDDKKIASGSVLELKSVGTHNYKCVATNVIRGKNYETRKNITVNVNSKPDVDDARCAEAIICKNGVIALIAIVVGLVVLIIVGVIVFRLRHKICDLYVRNQTPPNLQEMVLPIEQMELQQHQKLLPEGDKNVLPPGAQNDLNDQNNHKEYNDGLSAANSMVELGPLVAFRSTGKDDGSSIHPESRYAQPVDSEISEDEGLGAHPENCEGASLLRVTLAETEDKMRKSNSTLPSSAGVEVLIH